MCANPATLNQPPPIRSPRAATNRPWTLAGLLLLSLALGSCMTQPASQDVATADVERPSDNATVSSVAYCRLPLAELTASQEAQVWDRLRQGFALWDVNHPRLQRELARLQAHPAALQAMLEEARPWLYYIAGEIEQRQLPMELALLPAVESGFRPYAHSASGAAGLWQFMPATGRWRGLTQDWWYDGRRDLVDGTGAALTHLESLNQRLDGDWLNTLAAYNAGRGTVSRAIRRNAERDKPTDYWSLDLPNETDNYVPRLLALSAIIANPERYGVELPQIPNQPQFAIIETQGQIDLGVAAKMADTSVDELARLNAGLNRLATPPEGPHRLLIPVHEALGFQNALAELPDEQRLQRSRYQVKPGDTLSGIASAHGITVAALKSANDLKRSRIRAGQHLIVPHYPSALALAPVSKPRLPHSRVRYRVRNGDSLYEIAQKFRVSVGQLRRWNRLDGNLVKPGQQLTLYVDPARQTL